MQTHISDVCTMNRCSRFVGGKGRGGDFGDV